MKYILLLAIAILNIHALDAFITPSELKKSMKDSNLIIIDVEDKSIYKKNHIAGAINADTRKFCANKKDYSALVSKEKVQKELAKLGINSNSTVVIYSHNSEKGFLNSSFLAFVLIHSGFENVSILDGGYMAWVFQNELLTSTKTSSAAQDGNISVKYRDTFVNLEYVDERVGKVAILDSRSSEHYYGIKRSKGVESIGHIPTASSSYYKDKFLTDMTLREQKELDEMYIDGHGLNKDSEVIIYGDTIFSASMNWYILYKHMGFTNLKIYEGSMLEWGNSDEVSTLKYKWE